MDIKNTCRRCRKEYRPSKSNRVFCTPTCQVGYHKEMSTRRCSQCGLVHPSVTKGSIVCVHCLYLDVVRYEKQQLADRIEWLRDRGICFYCGEFSSEREHVVPRRSGLPTYTVRACGECNSLAGGELFTSILDKLQYVKERRTKKYSAVLRMPEWTPDELKDLGYAIKVRVESSEQARQLVKSQLAWFPLLAGDD